MKIIILDRLRKSRETFDRFIVYKNVKKITQSQRHLRSASEGTLLRAGAFCFDDFYDVLLLRARITNPR